MRGRTAVAERGEFALPPLRTEVVVAGGVGVDPARWTGGYLRGVVAADCLCAVAAGVVALLVRFDGEPHLPAGYLASTLILPVIWVFAAACSGAYDARFIGVGSDECRRVLNAAVSLTAAVAIMAYATQTQVARGYVVIALPSATVLDLSARYWLRKRLHRLRGAGLCMHKAVAVGHREAVDSLISELARARHYGLDIVAVGLPDGRLSCQEVEGVTVYGNLSDVTSAVRLSGADTVAVLGCPEMDGLRLRRLAWDLEKTGTDLCVAPALMDVAGPPPPTTRAAGGPGARREDPGAPGAWGGGEGQRCTKTGGAGRRCRPRRPSTATTCGAGSSSSPGSPACGR